MRDNVMNPSSRDLKQARDEFRHLLSIRSREADWQRFFSSHPFVLSLSLPLQLEPADIVPFGRPGRAEPDFLFYPKHTDPIPYYGVIELKRPSSKLISVPRSNVAIFSRDAETAIQQAVTYSRNIELYAPALLSSTPVLLGNREHLFVIMGMSIELSQKLATDVYRDIMSRRLPGNIQLLPYDTLLQIFESHVPPHPYFLIPKPASPAENRQELLRRIKEMWKVVYNVAVNVGVRNEKAFARSAHGYRPEWLIRTWLPESYSNVDSLRKRIESGLPRATTDELENITHALGAAVVQARSRK